MCARAGEGASDPTQQPRRARACCRARASKLRHRKADLKDETVSDPPFKMVPVGNVGIGRSKKETIDTVGVCALGRRETCWVEEVSVEDTCIKRAGNDKCC